jgi:hypothetical protein
LHKRLSGLADELLESGRVHGFGFEQFAGDPIELVAVLLENLLRMRFTSSSTSRAVASLQSRCIAPSGALGRNIG